MSYRNELNISELLGKIITKIDVTYEKIFITTDNDDVYLMYHEQDCCESVTVDDVIGDIEDLLNNPILVAEERTNSEDDEGRNFESFTWTFYELATIKGSVTIKWLGESNGYYSERVSFIKSSK